MLYGLSMSDSDTMEYFEGEHSVSVPVNLTVTVYEHSAALAINGDEIGDTDMEEATVIERVEELLDYHGLDSLADEVLKELRRSLPTDRIKSVEIE
jgi:hypothetical protein